MQTPEVRLMNEIKIYCGTRNWLCYHLNQGLFYTKFGGLVKMDTPVGWPDLLVITDYGEAAFMETKIKPRKPTREQLAIQAELRKRGFRSETVYSLEEFIEAMSKEKEILK